MTILLAIWKFVPWQVWATLAAGLALFGWLTVHDHRIRAAAVAERDAYWQGEIKKADAKFAAAMDKKRGEVSDLVLKGIAERDANAVRLRDEAAKHDEDFAALKAQRPTNVTPKDVAACDLHAGVIVQFNDGAAFANGIPRAPTPPNSTPDALRSSSGVPLDTYTAAVEDTQNALGVCRAEVAGWQKHWATVTAWYESLRLILNSCFPSTQGAP